MTPQAWDVAPARRHDVFAQTGRVVTHNAGRTQPPRERLNLVAALAPRFGNLHRGQSSAA